MKPPAPKQAPLSPEQVEALARLGDPNYGKTKPAGKGEAPVAPPPPNPEKPSEAAKPEEGAQPPAEPAKTAPEPDPAPLHTHRRADDPPPTAEDAKKPWEVASTAPKAVNFQPDELLHAKMEWVSKNVPGGMSRLRMVREGVAMLCDQLIEKHYKP
jgi:hypothetical protein